MKFKTGQIVQVIDSDISWNGLKYKVTVIKNNNDGEQFYIQGRYISGGDSGVKDYIRGKRGEDIMFYAPQLKIINSEPLTWRKALEILNEQ